MTISSTRRRLLWLSLGIVLFGLGLTAYFASNWVRLARQDCRVAVVMLHQVIPNDRPTSRYAMRETEFAGQLEALAGSGVRLLSETELLRYLTERSGNGFESCPWGTTAAMVTFDMDGPSYHVELALPHLVRHQVPALFFVPTGFLDQGRAVSSIDVSLLAKAGMTLGSHSQWHQNLTTVTTNTLIGEIANSRDTLSALTGQSVSSLAAPGGRYDNRVLRDARSAGIEAFFNSDPCFVNPDTSPLRICRIEIRGDRGPTMLQAIHSSRVVATQATSWHLKRTVERLVGQRGFSVLSRVRSLLGGG